MDSELFNNHILDKKFISISISLLKDIEEQNSNDKLRKIKFQKLEKLARDLDSYQPENEIRKEKKYFLKYLRVIQSRSINKFSKKELLELERDYLFPSINGKLREIGYTTNYAWLLATFFGIPFDLVLLIFFGEYFYYIPFVSLFTAASQLIARKKAKMENKLW